MRAYGKSWGDYKRLQNAFAFVLLTYVPTCFVVAYIALRIFHTLVPAFLIALLWMGAFLVTGMRLQCWACPRCGEPFSAKGWYNRGFLVRRCVHCGLPKYADEDFDRRG